MLATLVTGIIFLDVVNGDLYNYEYAELSDSFDDEYSVEYNTLHAEPGRVRRIPANNVIAQTRFNVETKDAFERIVSKKTLDNFTTQVSRQTHIKRTKKEQQTSIKLMPLPQEYFDAEYNSPDGFDERLRPTIVHIDTRSTEDTTKANEASKLKEVPLSTSEVFYDTETATEGAFYYYFAQTLETSTAISVESPEKPTLYKSEIYVQIPRRSYTDVPIRSLNLRNMQPDVPKRSSDLPNRSSPDLQITSDLTGSSLYEYETYVQNPETFKQGRLPDKSKISSKSISHASDISSEELTESTYEYESYIQNPSRLNVDAPERSPTIPIISTPNYAVHKLPGEIISYQNIRTPSVLPPDRSPKLPNRSSPQVLDRSPELEADEESYIFESYDPNPRRWYMKPPEKSSILPNRSPPLAPNRLNADDMSFYRYESHNRSPQISSLRPPERSPKLPNRSSQKVPDRLPNSEQGGAALSRYDSYNEIPRKSSFPSPERSPKLPNRSSSKVPDRSPKSEEEEIALYRYDSFNKSPEKSTFVPPHRSPKLPNRSSPQLPDRSVKLKPEDLMLHRYDTYSKNLRKSSVHPHRPPKLPNRSSPHVPIRSEKIKPEELSMYRYQLGQGPRKSSLHSERPKLPNRSSPHAPYRSTKIRPEEPYLQGNESFYRFRGSPMAPTRWREMGLTTRLLNQIIKLKSDNNNLPKLQDNTIENDDEDEKKREDYIPDILLRQLQARNNNNRVFGPLTDDDMKAFGMNILRNSSSTPTTMSPTTATQVTGSTTSPISATTSNATLTTSNTTLTTSNATLTTSNATLTTSNATLTTSNATLTTSNATLTTSNTTLTTSNTSTVMANTTITTPTPTTTVIRYDIARFLAIIANLTYDYDTNLTMQVNYTLTKLRWPTCGTPAPPTTTTTTPPPPMDYSGFNGSLIAKCFVCGLETEEIPYEAHCADAFAGDFIPLVPQDPRARSRVARYRKYCRLGNVRNYHLNATYPRAIYGEWTGGCAVRWTDVTGVYTQRTCRNKLRPTTGRHFASKRMAKLERALLHEENGCIISPVATLLPLSRGISLYARFHACVCTGNWCNTAPRMHCACVTRALLLVALARIL